MMHPDQQTLDGEKVGEPFAVEITETYKSEGENEDTGKVEKDTRKATKAYRGRWPTWQDATIAALEQHQADSEEWDAIAVKVTRG